MSGTVLRAANEAAWLDALARVPGRDVYFLPGYHRACEVNGDGTAFAFVFTQAGDTLFHPFLVRAIPPVSEGFAETWYDAESVNGYVGPLATTDEPGFLDAAWTEHGRWCVDQGVVAEFVRFNPLSENVRFAGPAFGVSDDRPLVVVPLDAEPDDLWRRYGSVQRNMVRKALSRGLAVAELDPSEEIDAFLGLYSATMERQATPVSYRPSRDSLACLAAELGPCLRLFGVHHDGDLVAAGMFLVEGDRMHYHLAGSTELGRASAANNLLLHAAAEWGITNGCRWLHLGGGRTARDDDALLRFKLSISSSTRPYALGRTVHDVTAFNRLCDEWRRSAGGRELGGHTFPYRSPVPTRSSEVAADRELP